MLKSFLITVVFLSITNLLFGQVDSRLYLGAQAYNKEVTEYMTKRFLVDEVLEVTSEKILKVEIDGLTSAKSGELTTVLYSCDQASGIVLAFWDDYINEYNTLYKGYAFKNLPKKSAIDFLAKIDPVQEEARDIRTSTENIIYKWEDLTFVFYRDVNTTKVRVFWKTFDADWDVSNLKSLIKKYKKKS